MISRIVPLNKEAPKIGKVEKFRPIVVASPVLKFLEGLIIGSLR